MTKNNTTPNNMNTNNNHNVLNFVATAAEAALVPRNYPATSPVASYFDTRLEDCPELAWIPPQPVVVLITNARDTELIWYAIYRGVVCVAIEPPAPRDEDIARSLGIRLLRHLDHPEIPWIEVYRNLNEET